MENLALLSLMLWLVVLKFILISCSSKTIIFKILANKYFGVLNFNLGYLCF